MIKFIAFIIILVSFQTDCCQAATFGSARRATPVLNSSDFSSVFGGQTGTSLKTDRCGQVREMEYIAFPGAVFKILGEFVLGSSTIYQVETEEYQASTGTKLYVDSRFLELHSKTPPPRKRYLPPREDIISTLIKSVGSPYVWGGNVQCGVPELMQYFYRDTGSLGNRELTLAGLDCSGLLYQATSGWTPRNTSQLLSYGNTVAIKGKNVLDITRLLEPLDLIAWNGHVIIVLDGNTVIESRLECGKAGNGGVVTTSLQKRLSEIMRTRRPADKWPNQEKQRNTFVVRRWYGFQ